MIKNITKASVASTIAIMLIGCGGGGGSTPATAPATQNPTSTPIVTNNTLCSGSQTTFALSKEVNGDLNIVKDNIEDCYKINLSSNHGSETYTFFMNMLPGTKSYGKTAVTLIDENNQEIPLTTKTLDLYQEGKQIRKTFEISKDGTYYIKIKRERYEAKYAFSLHPSVENGLVQGKDKEINDTPSMAAPITLTEAMNDINGSLHVTRDAYNSLRGTDDTDYYSIDIAKAGKYTFFMNNLPGTEDYGETDVRFFDDSKAETPITIDISDLFSENDNIRKEITLAAGKHHIKIQRESKKMKYAFSLHPSIKNGLVQNTDREPNDTPSMAAPLSMEEVAAGIRGSLNFTRDTVNSLRGTDNIDRYRMTITEAGDYTVDMSLLEGSGSYETLDARFISDDGDEIPLSESSDDLYRENDTHSADVTLDIGSYTLKISRTSKIAKYSFKMTMKN